MIRAFKFGRGGVIYIEHTGLAAYRKPGNVVIKGRCHIKSDLVEFADNRQFHLM